MSATSMPIYDEEVGGEVQWKQSQRNLSERIDGLMFINHQRLFGPQALFYVSMQYMYKTK